MVLWAKAALDCAEFKQKQQQTRGKIGVLELRDV